jgi:hypothetical protein
MLDMVMPKLTSFSPAFDLWLCGTRLELGERHSFYINPAISTDCLVALAQNHRRYFRRSELPCRGLPVS